MLCLLLNLLQLTSKNFPAIQIINLILSEERPLYQFLNPSPESHELESFHEFPNSDCQAFPRQKWQPKGYHRVLPCRKIWSLQGSLERAIVRKSLEYDVPGQDHRHKVSEFPSGAVCVGHELMRSVSVIFNCNRSNAGIC